MKAKRVKFKRIMLTGLVMFLAVGTITPQVFASTETNTLGDRMGIVLNDGTKIDAVTGASPSIVQVANSITVTNTDWMNQEVEKIKREMELDPNLQDAIKRQEKQMQEILNDKTPFTETASPVSQKDPRGTTPKGTAVYQQTNFLEMRKALEKLTGSYVTESGGFGGLYRAERFGREVASDNPPFRSALSSSQVKKINSKDLKDIASLSFKDIKGTEWYASQLPLAVYYGLINGYEDGTFRGNVPVTRAEMAVMMGNYEKEHKPGNMFSDKAHEGKWYWGSLGNFTGAYIQPEGLTVKTINEGMTRAEVANTIAVKYFNSDVSSAWDKIEAGNYGGIFSDIKSSKKSIIVTAQDNYYNKGKIPPQFYFYDEYMKACKDTAHGIPKEYLAPLMALNEMGIIVGDDLQRSNWNKPVTRAEAVTIFSKLALIH